MALADLEYPLPAPITDIPDWSENFCLASFDRDQGVAVWVHLGRWRRNTSLWRETMVVALPDGTIYAHRGYGDRRATATGPGGNSLAFNVEQPGHQMSYSFAGGAPRTSSVHLMQGLLGYGPMEPLSFDLTFDSNEGLWDLHGVGDVQAEFMAGMHVEQIGRVTGTIRIGDRQIDYNAMGNRDHSRGARRLGDLKRHHWVQAQFDDGTGVLIFDAEIYGEEQPVFTKAAACKDGKIYNGKLTIHSRIEHLGQAADPYDFTVECELGTLNISRTRAATAWLFTNTHPNDMYIGVLGQGGGYAGMLEQPSFFTLNGTIQGFGCSERTVPGKTIDETAAPAGTTPRG